MLWLGATKVELGVQSTRDEILERMGRGHLVSHTVDANCRLREAGLKVGFHLMPGLPGSSPELDMQIFEELFEMEELRPDYLKIYPTLVIEGTELFRMYQQGEYIPYGDEEAADLISRIKEILPPLRQAAASAEGHPCPADRRWPEEEQPPSEIGRAHV